MSLHQPLIAHVHATLAAVEPATWGFARAFPEAGVWNVVDDRLIEAITESGELTPQLFSRMTRLLGYVVDQGPDAILLTCSMYGPVVEQARDALLIPILTADEALFGEVVSRKLLCPLVVGTTPTSVDDSLTRLRTVMALGLSDGDPRGMVVPSSSGGAREDQYFQAKAIAEAVGAEGRVDAVVLAQYSLAPIAISLGPMIGVPVLAGPTLAGAALRADWKKRAGVVR